MGIKMILIIVLVVNLLLDFYLFVEIKKLKSRAATYTYMTVAGTIILLSLAVVCLPWKFFSGDSLLSIMCLLFVICTLFISKLVVVLISAIGKFTALFVKKTSSCICGLKKTFNIVGVIIGCTILCVMLYGSIVTVRTPVITEVIVESERLPNEFDGLKVVQLSDFHLGSFGDKSSFVSDVVDMVNSTNPDLVLFTGDLVNSLATEAVRFKPQLSGFRTKYGVWSVLGNHDYGDYYEWSSPEAKAENLKALKDFQAECGWNMLNNEHAVIGCDGDSIVLIGVENWGDYPFPKYGKLGDAYSSLKDDKFKILMSHNPVHWRGEVLPNSNIDLMLAGHTHAMQVVINICGFTWSPAELRYEEWGGLYERDNQKLYVNKGLGFVGVPMRIGANPEITLITLKRRFDE